MSTGTTYQSLHTDSFMSVSLDFSVLKQNFTVLNQFIRNFIQFQKKFAQMQKSQKSINQVVSSFKLTTQSQFSTITEVLQSRSQITQGKSSVANEQLSQIKKSVKQLKTFITQSTRQQSQAQEIRQKQQSHINTKLDERINQIQLKDLEMGAYIKMLEKSNTQLKQNSASKAQMSGVHFQIQKQQESIGQLKECFRQVGKVLMNTKVQQFKCTIDEIALSTKADLEDMKVKFNTKSNASDLLKLEQMILNVVQFGFQNVTKVMANKMQTKKALIFLEKRLNSMLITLLGQDQNQRQALLTAKNIKCISCSKDFGQMQGKLDKYKAWSVFPVKQPNTKDKYSGFGAGFQSIVQSTIAKKGGEVVYDDKRRMIAPFNLTSTIQGSFMKTSKSQHKIQHSDSKLNLSPNKNSLKYQTNFMHQFGKQNGKSQINIVDEYYSQFKGLENYMISQGKTYQKSPSK